MNELKGVAYSVLDLAPVRKGGSIAETLRHTLELARQAEEWGYTRFWLAEHHNMPGIASAATSVLIGYVAGGTQRIRVGSGGVMLPNHAALVIAEQFGTLETLYPGRIDLGVGRAPGSDGLTARALRRGMNAEEEFPRQVGELLAYLGPAGEGQRLRAVPGAGTNVPVWLLGSSMYSAELAAQLGLPFAFASHFAPAMLMDALRAYREGFRPSPYLERPYAMAGLPVVAAESDEEARYLATSGALRFLDLIRGQELYLKPPVESMEGVWTPTERVAVESKTHVAVVGGPSTVREKLARFLRETRVDEVIFTSDVYDPRKRLRSFELAAESMRELGAWRPDEVTAT